MKKIVGSALVAIFLLIPTANAALLRLSAISSVYPDALGDFAVTFLDNGDNRLQFNEVQSFSGEVGFGNLFPFLVVVPEIPEISTSSCATPPCLGGMNWWAFGLEPGLAQLASSPSNYTYSIREVQQVPEPGTFSLLVASIAVGGVVLVLRNRRLT